MLFLFAFVLGGFPLSDVVLNFISLHPVVPGYIAFIWTKFVPFDRDLGCFNQDPGTPGSRSPYKRNRENNSKLSTSRDPGTPGRPGTPGSYKQA